MGVVPGNLTVFVWDFPTLCQERRYFCLYLFICIREPSLCDLVSIRKREDPANECLCVVAIARVGCCQLANYFDLFPRCD